MHTIASVSNSEIILYVPQGLLKTILVVSFQNFSVNEELKARCNCIHLSSY